MAKLTRSQMEGIIRQGGSVMVGDKIITSIGELPSAAVLALGDEDAEQATRESLEAQAAEIQNQLTQLPQKTAKENTAVATTDPKTGTPRK